MYERGSSSEAEIVLDWGDGLTWIAHPGERSQRASHALRTERGVWLVDPLDAPEIDEHLPTLGEVRGVAVTSCWHARDAGTFASRHDVAVHIPAWMDRIAERVEAPVERYTFAPGDAGLRGLPCRPFPLWQEIFLYHEPTATLVVGESLGTTDIHRIEDERLGLVSLRRLQPPRQLAGLAPERLLVGHGEPISDDAAAALESALQNARSTFPKVLLENGTDSMQAFLRAVLE